MKGVILGGALAMGMASAASAVTIVNGSFEDTEVSDPFDTYGTGSTGISGWTVGSGSVDVVSTLWTAQDGSQAVDLDGSSVGSIFQVVTGLVVGQAYKIGFYMSGNPDGAPTIKTMDVSIGGALDSYSFDDSTGGAELGIWEFNSLSFVAGANSETLTFASTTAGSFYGPALDDVTISAVPLPAGSLLLLGGLLGFGALRRTSRG